jgi:hypothetical protein
MSLSRFIFINYVYDSLADSFLHIKYSQDRNVRIGGRTNWPGRFYICSQKRFVSLRSPNFIVDFSILFFFKIMLQIEIYFLTKHTHYVIY